MDTITHSLVGTTFFVLFDKEENKSILKKISFFTLCIVASNFPDIDAGLMFFNKIYYMIYHRGITHSIFLQPVFAYFLTLIFYKLYLKKEKIYSFKKIYLIVILSLYFHIFMDLLTSYGTKIFLPFSNKKYSFDLFFIIEPNIWILFFIPISFKLLTQQKKIFKFLVLLVFIGFFSLIFKHLYIQNQTYKTIEKIYTFSDYKLTNIIPAFYNFSYKKIILENKNFYLIGLYNNSNFITTKHRKIKSFNNKTILNLKNIKKYINSLRYPVWTKIYDNNYNPVYIIYDAKFFNPINNKIFLCLKISYDKKKYNVVCKSIVLE